MPTPFSTNRVDSGEGLDDDRRLRRGKGTGEDRRKRQGRNGTDALGEDDGDAAGRDQRAGEATIGESLGLLNDREEECDQRHQGHADHHHAGRGLLQSVVEQSIGHPEA